MKKKILIVVALLAALSIPVFAATSVTATTTSYTPSRSGATRTQTIVLTYSLDGTVTGTQNVDATMPTILGPVTGGSIICKTGGAVMTGGTPAVLFTLDPAEGTIGEGKYASFTIANTTPPTVNVEELFETVEGTAARPLFMVPGGVWKSRVLVNGSETAGVLTAVCTITIRTNS